MSAVEFHGRHTSGFDQRLAGAVDRLTLAANIHAGRIVQATSLGAEDMVLTDLVARHRLGIAVATLQTGKLHAETLALIPAIRAHYGIDVERWEPRAEAVVQFVRNHGERAMYESVALRKNCCAIRKLEPLSRMLNERSAWVTGLRREQSAERSDVPFGELDDAGRTKFNPLADWSQADVWHYIRTFEVPYNALHDRFFPSIGCEPCTRAIALGEDVRAGRWWWESEGAKECGLHVHPAAETASSSTLAESRFTPGVPA
ncbi:MAG: phosphoadenylyl-sulfate reductase [Caldimonas sp.]